MENADYHTALMHHLGQFVTDHKKGLIDEVLARRTRHLSIVVEDLYQPHNASATIRTADCMGLQEVHIVENRNTYSLNPDIALGASKWVDMLQYPADNQKSGTQKCLEALKAKGMKIAATHLAVDGVTPMDIPLDAPLAVVFGNEEQGVTQEVLDSADYNLRIPMFGFTQSFNISVSVAIVLSHLVTRLHASEFSWRLSLEEQNEIRLKWFRRIVKRSDTIETVFREQWRNDMG
ncbi:MAG: RNA methyltransferase [Bacteroidota bacterium]